MRSCAFRECLISFMKPFGVVVLRTDSYKQLQRLLVCLCPTECIEGLFSVLVHLHSSVQLYVQRELDKLYKAVEVVVLLEKHCGKKLFSLTLFTILSAVSHDNQFTSVEF